MRRIILEYRKERLRMLSIKGKQIGAYEKISLREMPREHLITKIKTFKGKEKRASCVLMLPRSSVLERRFDFEADGEADPNVILREKVRQTLPLSLDEMGYGVAVEKGEHGYRGTVLAIPLSSLKEILEILDEADMVPDEIVTSDQALHRLATGKEAGAQLVFGMNTDETEVLMIRRERILGFRVLHGEVFEIIEELNFLLLESGERPGKVVFCGNKNTTLECEIERMFPSQCRRVDIPEKIPPALYGASLLNHHPVISLLPNERKIKKKEKEQKKLRMETGLIFGLFLLSCLIGVSLHQFQERSQQAHLEKEFQKLRPQLNEIGKQLALIEIVQMRSRSNGTLLLLLKGLSREVPGEVILDELVGDETMVRIRGSSPSYSGVTGTSQALEKLEFLEPPHLEYARLKKKESRDFFEFEITAGRKPSEASKGKEFLERLLARPSRENLQQVKTLVQKKELYEKEYESIFGPYRSGLSPGDLVNDWVRDLMSFLDLHHLKVDQLTPRGIQESNSVKRMQVSVRAKGSMENLMAVLYDLAASHAAVHVERIQIAPGAGETSTLSYEIDFARIIPHQSSG